MTFRDDTRAVTVQVGAVLLFGMIIISMSMYQATVVPNQNEQVEFQHNQQVHNEFTSLRGAIVASASEPTTRPTTISLGSRYPSRTLFVNPGPVSGTLQTRPLGTLTVANISTTDSETDDYLADGPLSFETSAVEYRPDYNLLQTVPTTTYENTLAYNRFESGYNGTLTGQSLVDGRSLSLVILDGSYSENGVSSATIDAQAVSPATRTVSVTNNESGRNVTVTVPTKLSAADWQTILADAGELDGSGDTSNSAYVHAVRNRSGDSVVFVMERDVTYNLRIGAVGVGRGVESPRAHYLTVADVGSSSVTFEVRDQYNNPVSGATVNTTVSPSTTLSAQGQTGTSLTNLSTDADGQVSVALPTAAADTYAVNVSLDRDPASSFDAARRQEATADVVVAGGGAGGGGGSSGAYELSWDGAEMDAAGGSAVDYYSGNDTLVVNSSSVSEFEGFVDVTDTTDSPVSNVDVDFATNDSTVLTAGLGNGSTNANGVATTTISVADGVANAYATVDGSYDTITVKVVSPSGGGGGGGGSEPFLDVDDDGVKDPDETTVPISELDGGSYNSNTPLVIPESVTIDAGDSSVSYNVPSLNLSGSLLSSRQITVNANSGDIVLDNSQLSTSGTNGGGNDRLTLTAAGSISAVDAEIEGAKDISMTANGGGVDLRRSTVRSPNGQTSITANNGDIDVRDATFVAKNGRGSVTYTVNNGVLVEGNTTYTSA